MTANRGERPAGEDMAKAYVIGTCDTKGQELAYLKRLL
jgi:hypothetical protein